MSAYYIWNPYVPPDHPKTLDFVITNGDVPNGIPRSKEFIERVLKDMGIEANVASWSIEPYRTSYYSEYLDEDDWRGIWQLVWKARVVTTKEIGKLPEMRVPWIGTNATGRGYWEGPDDDAAVGCLVISDFDSEGALKKAQAAITDSDELKEMQQRYSVGAPAFSRSEVLGKYQQLQIDLGEFSGEFFAQGADYAQRVMELCQQAKGTVHFEARD